MFCYLFTIGWHCQKCFDLFGKRIISDLEPVGVFLHSKPLTSTTGRSSSFFYFSGLSMMANQAILYLLTAKCAMWCSWISYYLWIVEKWWKRKIHSVYISCGISMLVNILDFYVQCMCIVMVNLGIENQASSAQVPL